MNNESLIIPAPELDNCLKCGGQSEVIVLASGPHLTCVRCGWVERYDYFVPFAPQLRTWQTIAEFLANGTNSGFTNSVLPMHAGCSGLPKQSPRWSRNFIPPVDCSKAICRSCGSPSVRGGGSYRNVNGRIQRFICKRCTATFSIHDYSIPLVGTGKAAVYRSRLPADKRAKIARLFTAGLSIRRVAIDCQVSQQTAFSFRQAIAKVHVILCQCGKPKVQNHKCEYILATFRNTIETKCNASLKVAPSLPPLL